MGNFEKVIVRVIDRYEGKGLSNHAADKGGMTYRGISRRYFSRWEGWEIIDTNGYFDERLDAMTVQFYKTYFWDVLRLDEVDDAFTQEVLFGFGINIGHKACAKKCQRLLDVPVDGMVGPITLRAINTANRREFIPQFLLEVLDLYHHIVTKNRSQKVFLTGWVGRVVSVYHTFIRE